MHYENDTIRQLITNYKSRELVPLVCSVCNKSFLKKKNEIQWTMVRKPNSTVTCSTYCGTQLRRNGVTKVCTQCGKSMIRKPSSLSQSGNCFCSASCAAVYTNTHKTIGTRRSKLEQWLEQELTKTYPDIDLHFNRKDAINSELDIYIPSLKLAFELNGIFHYEPIYGPEKLELIRNNDTRKFQACLEQGIELCIIDSSKQQNFTEKSSGQFLTIITTIINQKLK